jgi:hypothetical protein
MQLADLKLGRHNDQQSLIITEMSAVRKKLEEENQLLRDELDDAHKMIELLKVKLRAAIVGSVRANPNKSWFGNMNAANVTSRDIKAFEKGTKQFFSGNKVSKRNTFLNPAAPNQKKFQPSSKRGPKRDAPAIVVFSTASSPFPKQQRRQQSQQPATRCQQASMDEMLSRSVMDKLTQTIIHDHSTEYTRNNDPWFHDNISEL